MASSEFVGSLKGSDAAQLVEFSEGLAYDSLVTGAPPHIREQYGLSVERAGSAYALVSSHVAGSLILNRVIGLGVREPANDDILDSVEDIYRSRGVATYAAEVSPMAEPGDLPARLRTRGFVPFKQTAILYRSTEEIPATISDFSVEETGPEHAAILANITCGIFKFEEPFPSLIRATCGREDWQHWLAFCDGEPIASAICHLEREAGWIGWVATLPEYRGRGAQSLLTAAQIGGARSRGCRWVTLETNTGTKTQPSQSLRNYLRLGWTLAYDRLIYVRRTPARRPE